MASGLGRVVLEEEQERERSKSQCLYHCNRLHDRSNIEEEIFPRAKIRGYSMSKSGRQSMSPLCCQEMFAGVITS